MEYTEASYANAEQTAVTCKRDGITVCIPCVDDNYDYAALKAKVEAGEITIGSYVEPIISLKVKAQMELDRTDNEWGGRLAEDAIAFVNGTPLPEITKAKIVYREALRAIKNGTSTATELPTDPTK